MAVSSHQKALELSKRSEDVIKASSFRATAGGYVYRAPNPWVFGRSDHFRVTETQRAAIIDILIPKPGTREFQTSRRLGRGVLALTTLSLVTGLLVLYGNHYPAAEMIGAIAAVMLLAVLVGTLIALNRVATRLRKNLQPILSKAPQTDERISNADVLWAMRTSGGRDATRRQWLIGGGVSAMCSTAFGFIAFQSWQDNVSIIEKLQPGYLLVVAVWLAVQSGLSFYRARTVEISVAAKGTDRRWKMSFWALTIGYLAIVFINAGLQLSGTIKPDYVAMRARNERAANNGDGAAMNNLGWLYREGRGGVQDYAKAREWYQKSADTGNASSMFWMGWLSQKGLAGPQDFVAARQWFDKAATGGDGSAMTWNGWLYQNGQGVPKDYGKARSWFEQAAAANNTAGMHNLGNLYRNGWGTPKDDAKAFAWYEKAAKGGFVLSMNELGAMYTNGRGVAQSAAMAREWYEKAAAAGNLDGMQHAAVSLDRGDGGLADPARAAHLVLQSAKLGHPWSQKVLRGPMIFLTPATRTEIKRELIALAHYDGPIDDRWDDGVRATVEAYLKSPQ